MIWTEGNSALTFDSNHFQVHGCSCLLTPHQFFENKPRSNQRCNQKNDLIRLDYWLAKILAGIRLTAQHL